jgi:hypothetical protein
MLLIGVLIKKSFANKKTAQDIPGDFWSRPKIFGFDKISSFI